MQRRYVEWVESLLWEHGALAVSLTDEADRPVLEPGVGQTPLWPEVEVCGLFAKEAELNGLSALFALVPGVESPDHTSFDRLADCEWSLAWQRGLAAMPFGDRLWIVPQHLPPPPGAECIVQLDPGLAFGSGTHPSTRLCLEWLAGQDLSGLSVLDFGCGSGILGIAAARMGARQVLCVDNDPQALIATRENAQANEVEDCIEVRSSLGSGNLKVDVVLANILSGTLIALAPQLLASMKDNAVLVMAGILEDQGAAVMAAYAHDIPEFRTSRENEWLCLIGAKAVRAK